jgi:hypothetical protein
MGMCVQENIDIRWRRRWCDMDEAKANPVANEINHRGPFEIAIAIPAHQGNRRAQALQPNEQARRAKVTEMPDLVRAVNQSLEIFRQMIMGIGEDKNAKRRHFLFLHQLVRRNKENARNLITFASER